MVLGATPTVKPTPAPKPVPAPVPKPVPVPTPVPKAAPVPTVPILKCNYALNDQLAHTMRVAIAQAPSSCQAQIITGFKALVPDSPTNPTLLPFYVISECQTYLKTFLASSSMQLYNTSIGCMPELFGDAGHYVNNYPGNRITYMPSNACVPYLTSFIKDVLAYPDVAHLSGCPTIATTVHSEL